MLQRAIFVAIFALLPSIAFSYGSEDEKVLKFIRSHFSNSEINPYGGENLSEEDLEKSGLRTMVKMDFQAKDLWGNRDYIFGYGTLRDGSLVMMAWKNKADAQNISLKELSSIYTDERLASVQDDKALGRWRKMREEVAGAFINVRKSEGRITHLFPFETSESLAVTGRESLNQLVLNDRPLVIRFLPAQSNPRLRNLISALPER